jgi:prepilin-type N-terminal cleavage/methylation domain-containing protein
VSGFRKGFDMATKLWKLSQSGGRRRLRGSGTKRGGFTLLEMLVSIAVLMVVMGGMVGMISGSVQASTRTGQQADMYENVRGVAELMTQEIGQAGLLSLPASSLGSAVSASSTAQTVTVSSTTSMFVGEQVLIDAGATEEEVTLTAVTATTITAIFANTHASGAPIRVLGAFPGGIVPPGATDGSTANVLNLFGDINGDGTLVYVRYTCTPGIATAPGTLTRSVTTITPGGTTISASQTLLSTVIGGSGAVCFQYSTQTATAGATYTFVTNVGFTLSVQTVRPDPQTRQYVTMTKSFLNLAPRNILASYEMASAGISNRLQPSPTNINSY